MQRLLFAVLAIVLRATNAEAITYFVNSATGSDTNNGTSSTACGAHCGPFLTPQHAHDSSLAGDIINLNGTFGGGSSRNNPLLISRSGSIGRGWGFYLNAWTPGPDPLTAITYQTEPGAAHQAIINGSTDSFECLHIRGTAPHDIILQNLEIAGRNSAITYVAAWANLASPGFAGTAQFNGSGIVLDDNGSTPNAPFRVLIYRNNVHDFPLNGISVNQSDYVTIAENWVHDNALYAVYGPSGISVFQAVPIDGVTTYKTNVIGNVVNNNVNLIANRTQFVLLTTTASGTNTAASTTLRLTSTAGITSPRNWLTNGGQIGGVQVFNTTSGQAATLAPGTHVVSVTDVTHLVISPGIASTITAGDSIMVAGITDGEGIILDTNNANSYTGRMLVANNLIINNGASAIQVNNSSHADVVFNTTYLNQTTRIAGELFAHTSTDTNFFNNAMQGTAIMRLENTNAITTTTFGNNLGFGGDGTPLFGRGNVSGQNPLWLAPTITTPTQTFPISWRAFQLRPQSPARNAASGNFVRAADIVGFPGKSGSASDIGAYELPVWRDNNPRHRIGFLREDQK